MRIDQIKIDILFCAMLLFVIIGLPLAIYQYNNHHDHNDNHKWQNKSPENTREFTLTGHTRKGWFSGEIRAYQLITIGLSESVFKKPVIEVKKGDRVILKLKSSDVVHGFSLKDFGIFITDGIHPGKTVVVSFYADKQGTFTF